VLLYAVLAIGVIGWAGLRYHSFRGIPVVWTDTRLYKQVAAAPIWSGGFWAGPRTWGLPLLYKLVSGDRHRVLAQFLIADACWLALAIASARAVAARLLKVAIFAFVLAYSLLPMITQFEPNLLSDSLALSLTALLFAVWLELVRRPNWWWTAAALAVTLLWAGSRDSHTDVVLFTTPIIALTLLRAGHRRLKLVLLAGAFAIVVLGFATEEASARWREGWDQTVYTRLMKDPAVKAYFVSHLGSANWVSNAGRRVYAEYLLTHPLYTLTAPLSSRATDMYNPGRASYEAVLAPNTHWDPPAWYRAVLPKRLVDILYVPNAFAIAGLALVVAAVAGAYALVRRPQAFWVVPAAGMLVFYPHALVIWHVASADLDRHSIVNAIILRLSTVLLAVFVADAAWSSRSGGEPATERDPAQGE
jgi:hypothetical protein